MSPDIQGHWIRIIKDSFIPFLEQNGIRPIAFSRVVSLEASDHFTYSLLLEIPDLQTYQRYASELFTEYESIASGLFGDKIVWFTTLLKKI